MESSFRRLWRRKKSKDGGDGSRATSSAAYSRSDSIATQEPGRASATISRQGSKMSNGDVFVSNSDYLALSSSDYPRTKTGNRIQPILIGISRPAEYVPRPSTATSLNTAVQQAADTARVSQDTARKQSGSFTGHRRSISGRSIDILKVAGLSRSHKSRFNEEIAERNLDVSNVATEVGSNPLYIPTSRYQEEVADRNASGLFGSRTSLEYERSTSLTSKTIRSAASPPPVPQSPRSYISASSKPAAEQAAYHSRQYSVRSRDGGHQIPGAFLERVSEDGSLPDATMQQNREPRYFPRIMSPGRGANPILDTKPLPRLPVPPQQSDYVRREDTSHVLQGLGVASKFTVAGLVPVTDAVPSPPLRHPGRVATQQASTGETVPSIRDSVDSAGKPSSMLGPTSTKRTSSVADRKILDFTNDDVYSEASSTYGYSQYSPILQQANTGRFEHLPQMQQRNSFSQVQSTGTIPTEDPAIRSVNQPRKPVIVAMTESIPSEAKIAIPQLAQIAQIAAQPISFSPINTLASLKPHISDGLAHRQAGVSRDGRPKNAPAKDPQLSKVDSKVDITENLSTKPEAVKMLQRPPRREESMSRVQRAAAALEARSASQSPKPSSRDSSKRRSVILGTSSTNLHQSRSRSRGAAEEKQTIPISSIPEASNNSSAPQSLSSGSTTSTRNITPTPHNPRPSRQGPAQNTPSIYASPDSLRSVDYTNPASSFGVRTRDFAVAPVKPTIGLRKKSNPQLLKKTATENAYKVNSEVKKVDSNSEDKPSVKSPTTIPKARQRSKTPKRSTSSTYVPPKSEFDEEAFARKQAEAKVALLRLQQSLQEDFITLPLPVRTRKSVQKEDDGSPVAPSSIVYPQSILSSSPSKQPAVRPISGNRDGVKSPTSYRNPIVASHERAPSASSMRSRPTGSMSGRKAAPPSLKNVEAAAVPINHNLLPPSLQQILLESSKPPRSPGEISLSSFPIPSSRPNSEHETSVRPTGLTHMRRGSNRSQTSVASQFSIPFTMIPDRSSSYRDTVIEEDSS